MREDSGSDQSGGNGDRMSKVKVDFRKECVQGIQKSQLESDDYFLIGYRRDFDFLQFFLIL